MAEDSLALRLEKASADPAHKPEFVKALLGAAIIVMGEIEGEDAAMQPQTVLNVGTKVILRSQLLPDGKTIVPFFSSYEKFRAFTEGQAGVRYLAIPAATLFELARGSTLVLNPGSRVSMRISAEDLEKLMAQATSGAAPN